MMKGCFLPARKAVDVRPTTWAMRRGAPMFSSRKMLGVDMMDGVMGSGLVEGMEMRLVVIWQRKEKEEDIYAKQNSW
jgi:hypothetical protein